MKDINITSAKDKVSILDLVMYLSGEPNGVYRISLNGDKMYQAIKSNGEVTTLVNSAGRVFRRAFARSTKSSISYIGPEWVEVDKLNDINTFLLIAQVKGWI